MLQVFELVSPEPAGGVELAVLSLSKELLKLGHRVEVLTGSWGGERYAEVDGLKLRAAELAGLMERSYHRTSLSLLRQLGFVPAALRCGGEYDIYHGHVYSGGLSALLLARLRGGVAVNTIHGSYYPVWNQLAPRHVAAMYRLGERLLAPALARLCELQIHTATYFAEQVQSWGVPGEKLCVIPNGVDAEMFSPAVKPVEEHELPVVFTARRLVRKTGVDVLLRAAPRVLGEVECLFVVAGDGPERQRLEALARRLGVQRSFRFLGSVPHGSLPGYLAMADVVAVPSIIEATSLFVLEAMAMEKPVVATRVGGIPEVMSEREGVLVEAGNPEQLALALLTLLRDESLRSELGRRARQRVLREFTWGSVARRTEREYLRLLG
ncbi:MAG: glycosyltransferase family 4 protein [Euryarchaeota archaeon]|nr:glycosyltransferase family 4 protein [Euryarchaeota archaeon]